MKMLFSINKSKPTKIQNKNNINPQVINNTESTVSESFNFFQKTAMFKQILLPQKCGACGK